MELYDQPNLKTDYIAPVHVPNEVFAGFLTARF